MVEREKIGFVVPPGDRDGLWDGILFLYRHGEARKRMGDLARTVFLEKYSPAVGLAQYRKVLGSTG